MRIEIKLIAILLIATSTTLEPAVADQLNTRATSSRPATVKMPQAAPRITTPHVVQPVVPTQRAPGRGAAAGRIGVPVGNLHRPKPLGQAVNPAASSGALPHGPSPSGIVAKDVEGSVPVMPLPLRRVPQQPIEAAQQILRVKQTIQTGPPLPPEVEQLAQRIIEKIESVDGRKGTPVRKDFLAEEKTELLALRDRFGPPGSLTASERIDGAMLGFTGAASETRGSCDPGSGCDVVVTLYIVLVLTAYDVVAGGLACLRGNCP